MSSRHAAQALLDDWHMCLNARVPFDVIDLQLAKDRCAEPAFRLEQEYAWGESDDALLQACADFAPTLDKLKKQIVLAVLHSPLG